MVMCMLTRHSEREKRPGLDIPVLRVRPDAVTDEELRARGQVRIDSRTSRGWHQVEIAQSAAQTPFLRVRQEGDVLFIHCIDDQILGRVQMVRRGEQC